MRGYFFRQAWQNLNQNKWMNAVTLVTIALSFLVLGLFLVIFLNARGLMENWGSRIRVSAYLVDSVNAEQVNGLLAQIRRLAFVQEVRYRSKEEALGELGKRLQDRKGLLKGLLRNPLPASMEIQLKPAYRNSLGIQDLVNRLKNVPEIEELQFGAEWVERFSAFMVLLQVLGFSLGGVLLLVIFSIISNTIRLNIFARREEIEIMRSVGATGFFIRAPFYIEGLLQGLLGAALALAILFVLFQVFFTRIYEPMKEIFGDFSVRFLTGEQLTVLALAGLLLGLLGTQISVGRYLRP